MDTKTPDSLKLSGRLVAAFAVIALAATAGCGEVLAHGPDEVRPAKTTIGEIECILRSDRRTTPN